MTTQTFDQGQGVTDAELQAANGGFLSIGLCTAMTIGRGLAQACYWAERFSTLMKWGAKAAAAGAVAKAGSELYTEVKGAIEA